MTPWRHRTIVGRLVLSCFWILTIGDYESYLSRHFACGTLCKVDAYDHRFLDDRERKQIFVYNCRSRLFVIQHLDIEKHCSCSWRLRNKRTK